MIEYRCDNCKSAISKWEPLAVAVDEWRRTRPQSAAVMTEHFCPACAPFAGEWWDRKLEILAETERKLSARPSGCPLEPLFRESERGAWLYAEAAERVG